MAKKKKKKGLNNSAIFAIAAIVVSFCALAVSIYQSVILRNQQYAAVWPYINPEVAYSQSTFSFHIQNKGTGPAIIKDLKIILDGEEFSDYQLLTKKLLNVDQFYSISISSAQNSVIAAQEKMQLINVSLPDSLSIKNTDFIRRSRIIICYCSIFGDCWLYDDGNVKRKRKCE